MPVHSEKQLDEFKDQPGKLCVTMCKSTHCRPCKKFQATYIELAERFPDCFLLEVTGDESPELRKLMMKWQVRSTPTFFIYRGGEALETVTGTSNDKLLTAILRHLNDDERGRESGFNGCNATLLTSRLPPDVDEFCCGYAKTGRAKCNADGDEGDACKALDESPVKKRFIVKDDIRIGRTKETRIRCGRYMHTHWYHVECVNAEMWASIEALGGPAKLSGYDTLTPEDQALLFGAMEAPSFIIELAHNAGHEIPVPAAVAAAAVEAEEAEKKKLAAEKKKKKAAKKTEAKENQPPKAKKVASAKAAGVGKTKAAAGETKAKKAPPKKKKAVESKREPEDPHRSSPSCSSDE
ncbi:hypothetical protein FOA52_013985 [Chlamydomonas sp. UWO 241]|nr:hypothetical protein FOA52_013985 [Chlamydomonas sp. UWO 241]